MPEEAISSRVKSGMKNAERYCLNTELEIATYVELMCVGFPTRKEKQDPPEIQELMLDRRLAMDDRLRRLKAMLTA